MRAPVISGIMQGDGIIDPSWLGLLDIRDYGALGNDATDCTAAIQACADDAAYKAILIPFGTFLITSEINFDGSTCIFGLGVGSEIHAVGCNAFNVSITGALGGTEYANFLITGDNDPAHTAIMCLGTLSDQAYTAGATYNNIFIRDFGTGIWWRSVCGSRIVNCFINHVWLGISVKGKCIQNTIDNTIITLDYMAEGPIAGAGNSNGIMIQSVSDYDPGGVAEGSPESLTIVNSGIAGFDMGIYSVKCLHLPILHCDLDRITKQGITFLDKGGGITIRDSWISLTGADALYGIKGDAVGGTSVYPAVIEGNKISAYNSPHASSSGISLADYQDYAHIQKNFFTGWQLHDIKCHGTAWGSIKENHCASVDPVDSIITTNSVGRIDVRDNRCAGNENIDNSFDFMIGTLADAAAPSVCGYDNWKTGGVTTITSLPNGIPGHIYTITGDHSTTQLTDGATLKLAGNCILDIGDTIMLKWDGTSWHELSRTAV